MLDARPDRPDTKRALAKAMLQAMKEPESLAMSPRFRKFVHPFPAFQDKDAVELRRVLDAAVEAEVKLPGLEAPRDSAGSSPSVLCARRRRPEGSLQNGGRLHQKTRTSDLEGHSVSLWGSASLAAPL